MHDERALAALIDDQFGLTVKIQSVVLPMSDVSRTAQATVVLDATGELLAYITARAIMTLGDVKRLVRRMGLRPERFVPPKHQPNYFDDVATEKFQAVFPGMNVTSPDDLIYYRTLVPYNPALVVISEVNRGEIYQFDPDARGGYRVGARLHYKRSETV